MPQYDDPRIQGDLSKIAARLEKIETHFAQLDEKDRRNAREGRKRPSEGRKPGRPAADEPLDDAVERRAGEVTRQSEERAKAEERATREKEKGARAAERESKAARERYQVERSGQRSARVVDTATGQRQRGFRGSSPSPELAQREAVEKAERHASALNRASAAADDYTQAQRRSNEIIRHPTLFGRQAYTPTGPQFAQARRPVGEAGAAARPAAGIAAAEGRLSRAELDYAAARRQYSNTLRRKSASEGDVTSARQARQAAREEVAGARANLAATRAQVAAREAEVAVLRAATPAEAAARAAVVASLREEAAVRTAQAAQVNARKARNAAGVVAAEDPFRQLPPGRPQRALPAGGQSTGSPAAGSAAAAAAAASDARAKAGGRLTNVLNNVSKADRDSTSNANRAAQANRNWANTTAFTSRAEGLAADSLRRRGALTTEFISAAARGTTTLREMGFQVGATVAKFAGWTAAATAVFGAVGAIAELGRGAIETENGVNNLQRIIQGLNTDDARAQLVSLSREFNLPIKDVADAAYGMSKILGQAANPAQALTNTLAGTRAVLYAVKIGEVDAATATKYFTAIVGGFHLNAKQLPGLLDTINAAQNKFGGNFAQLAQGIGSASGAFKNAGSNYRELTTLLQVGTRVTGRRPQEIGTSLRRAAEIYRRPERKGTIMELLGIDPEDHSIYDVIRRAQTVAAKSSPTKRSEIAKAISTPELSARAILPIINSRELTTVIARGLREGAVKGSASRELATALKAPTERIARLRNDIQGIGADLARAGFLKPFTALLTVLDHTLDTAQKLVGIVQGLPEPLRTAANYALPLGATLAAARRFNVGGSAPEGSVRRATLSRAPGAQVRSRLLFGIGENEQAVNNERVRAARELSTAQRGADRAAREVALLTAGDAETVKARKAAVRRQEAAQRRALQAEVELGIAQDESAVLERQRVAVTRARFRNEQTVLAAYTGAGGVYAPNTLDRGSPRGRVQNVASPRERARFERFGIVPASVGGGVGGFAGAGARQLSQEEARLVQRARAFKAEAQKASVVGRAAGSAAVGGARAASGMGSALSGAGAGLSRLATGLGSIFGPIDAILAAGFIIYELYQHEKEQERRAQAAVDASERARRESGPSGIRHTRRRLRERVPYAGERSAREVPLDPNVSPINQPRAAAPPPSPERQEYLRSQEAERRAKARQDRGRGLYQSQIVANLRQRTAAAAGQSDREDAVAQAQREYDASLYRHSKRAQRDPKSQAAAAQTRDLINRYRARAAYAAKTLAGMDKALSAVETQAGFDEFYGQLQRDVTVHGLGRRQLRQGAGALGQLRRSLVNARGGAQIKTALQNYDTLKTFLLEQIDSQFQRALAAAHSPGAVRQAQRSAAAQVRALLAGERHDVRVIQQKIRRLRLVIKAVDRQLDSLATGLGGAAKLAHEGITRQSQSKLQKQLGPLDKQAQKLLKVYEQDRKANKDITLEQDKQADQRVDDLKKDEEQNKEDAEAARQRRIELFQARGRMLSAQALVGATQGARLTRALSDARSFYRFLQNLGGAKKTDLLDAQTAIFEAQDALVQYQREQAQELVRAKGELAKSRTSDPIKQAEIELRTATQLLRYAQTPAERIQALADINNRRKDLVNTRLQERTDQEQFLFDIGKISREQYADWIRRFLRGHKELRRINRELYRSLRRTLHSLTQDTENDLDLQVGQIRLPTLYDIRRIIKQGTRTASSGVLQQSNNFTINGATDPDAVGAAVETAVGNGGRAALRAAGMTG